MMVSMMGTMQIEQGADDVSPVPLGEDIDSLLARGQDIVMTRMSLMMSMMAMKRRVRILTWIMIIMTITIIILIMMVFSIQVQELTLPTGFTLISGTAVAPSPPFVLWPVNCQYPALEKSQLASS